MNNLNKAVADFLASVGVKGEYPIKITRLDLALDLFGVSMTDQDINLWINGWVGRSKPSGFFRNSRTGNLETIYVGSRKSAVFLRIYDKVAQAVAEGDISYWLDVWKLVSGPVTRIEWEIKPGDGNFSNDLRDFSKFNGFSFRELLNYLMDWGRLCEPDPTDNNKNRWKDSPFWENTRKLTQEWVAEVTWPTTRYGKEFHGISEGYIKFLSGTIAGGMARFGEKDPSIYRLLEGVGISRRKYGRNQ